MIRAPDQVIAITLRGVSPPSLIRLFNRLFVDTSRRSKIGKLLQFPLHVVFTAAAHLADNCARFGQVRMKAQEINTVFQWVNVRFRIQRKPARLHERFNFLPAMPQILFILVDQEEVVHIAPVKLDIGFQNCVSFQSLS